MKTEGRLFETSEEPFHKVVFENEHLRIFNVELPPHESTEWHRHAHDYYVVIVGAAEVEDQAAGQASQRKRFHGGEMHAGNAGFTHQVTNVGEVPFRNVVVEVKR